MSHGLQEAGVGLALAGSSLFLSVQGEGRTREDSETTPCYPPAPWLRARAVFVTENGQVRVKTGVMKTVTELDLASFFFLISE